MSDVYLYPSAEEPKDVTLRYLGQPITPPIISKRSFTIPIRYIKLHVLINRNGERVGYRTPYTPYRVERPIQPETG